MSGKRRQSVLPRWLHRLYAGVLGYFWGPCPLCGEFSGGHEWRDIDGRSSLVACDMHGGGRGICPACTRQGRGDQRLAG